MRRRRSNISTTGKVFLGLTLVSMVLFVMPTRWTGGFISAVQLLVPAQDAARVVAKATAELVAGETNPSVPAADCDALMRRLAAREHQTAALAARIEQLESEVRILSATRLWSVGGESLGSRGRLIPARVVAPDLLAWRSSRLIAAGSLQGVRSQSAVVSNRFTIDRGASEGLGEGRAILLGEALVGFVEQVGSHTSRVRLLTDPAVQMKVRIGRWTDDRVALVEGSFWLIGRGADRMEIREVARTAIETERIRTGDVVLSDPANETIPVAMTIGRISRITHDRSNPLFVALEVLPSVTESDLKQVYVFDLSPDPPPET